MPLLRKRTKNLIYTNIGTRAMYKTYIKEFDGKIKADQYEKILDDFFSMVVDKMVTENFTFILPYRLGHICVRKYKTRIKINGNNKVICNSGLDYDAMWNMWRREYPGLSDIEIAKLADKPKMFELNKHTNGWLFRIVWIKRFCHVENKIPYKFKPCRWANRFLAKKVKENKNIDFNLLYHAAE